MKNSYMAVAVSLVAGIGLMTGCGKKEQAPATAADAQKAVEQKAAEVQTAAQPAAAATATATTAPAVTAPAAVVPQANAEAQSLIDKAKALMADKKYTDALATLKDASAKQPTPDQKGLLDQLMAQVQKAITDNASSQLQTKATDALGGLLGGKK